MVDATHKNRYPYIGLREAIGILEPEIATTPVDTEPPSEGAVLADTSWVTVVRLLK